VLYSIQDPRQTVGDSSGESTTAPALNQSTFRSKSFIHDARPREQNTEEIIVRRATQVQRASCSRQYCHCSCHLTEEIRGHYWGFEFTPFSDLFGKCDNKECTARSTSWKARFALNKFRIPCALVIGLKLVSSTGTFTIQPALSLERVVKYTSTGFEILWKCRNNVISPSQARESFYELYQLDNGLKNHVNPDGKGYVQVRHLSLAAESGLN
jgi:hypothetical protein